MMQVITSEQSVEQIRKRLPDGGRCFTLGDALAAMEDFYANVRVDGCDDGDSLVVVAGKYGSRRFEVVLCRSFGLVTQIEILLRYPITLRCLFLKGGTELCESPSDSDGFFRTVRSSRWFRRFASCSAAECLVRRRSEEEMFEMFREVVPRLIDALGPDL